MTTAATGTLNCDSGDWRYCLFGPTILSNKQNHRDTEEPKEQPFALDEVPYQEAFDTALYDYIGVFIGADYCPHCKAFAPTVVEAASLLEQKKRCKVVFLSNDRTEEAFQNSCRKVSGIDVVPYDVEKTKVLRDLFDLKTIPVLLIFKNKDFTSKVPPIVTNARNLLVADPEAKAFPWEVPKEDKMSMMDRFIIRGKYGKWWELGHHVNHDFPDQIYMDEHAVRARAGLLNIMTWIAIINVFFWKEPDYVQWLFPIVGYEFLTSMFIGLTPLSPFGILGTLMSILFHPEPLWKPARPKRLAWGIGLVLSLTCFMLVTFRNEIGRDAYLPLVRATVMMCNVATWFESANGFCFGCFIYNTVVVPMYKLEQCSECKL